jgi:DNA-binding Lrp family transcriptional regulator
MGQGVTDDGAFFSQNTFKGPKGEKVFVLMIHYASPDGVKKRFEYEIAKATKVIELSTVTGEKGAKEERAVITIVAKDKNEASMILITAGNELVEVQSYSLRDALKFEKQAKH